MNNKIILVATTLSLLLLGACAEQIESGERGVETRFGAVEGGALEPGLWWYNPITTDIDAMDVKQQKWTGKAAAYTRDIQTAEVGYAITFHLDPTKVTWMYKNVGRRDWEDKLLPQVMLQAVKNEFGKNDAVDLIANRQAATNRIQDALRAKLGKVGIVVDGFDITNIDYDDAFEGAIEAKQVAVQSAITAQNKTVQITEEGKQTPIRAEAEAKAMKVRADALAQNPKLVEYEAVQKWDGTLPTMMMGSATPFINVGAK